MGTDPFEGPATRGTIRFGRSAAALNSYGYAVGFWLPTLDPTPQFLGIDDVQRVFALVQEGSHATTPGGSIST